MKTRTDVCIVGGGIIGLSCAFELARRGRRVTLLERGRVGREASWAAGGILTPIHLADYPEPLARLANLSSESYPSFIEEVRKRSRIDPELVPSGLLMLITDDRDAREVAKLVRYNRARGRPFEKLGAREVRRLEPAIRPDIRGALLLPDVRQVRNNRLCRALAVCLRRMKVDVREQTPAIRIRGRRAEVQTPKGVISSDSIVLAAGAWSAALGKVDVEPVRGQMVLAEGEPGFLHHVILQKDRYLIPRIDGRILIGSTLERVGFRKQVTLEGITGILGWAIGAAPGIAALPLAGAWAGLRPGGKSRIPQIGPLPAFPRVLVATGHYRNGILLAPATAKLVGDLLCGRQTDLDPAPFAPG